MVAATPGQANFPDAIPNCTVPAPTAGVPVTLTVSPGAVRVADALLVVSHACGLAHFAAPSGKKRVRWLPDWKKFVSGVVEHAPGLLVTTPGGGVISAPLNRPEVICAPYTIGKPLLTVEVWPVLQVIVDVPTTVIPGFKDAQFTGFVVPPVNDALPPVIPRPTQPLNVTVEVIVGVTVAGLPVTGSPGERVSV
jgi:hypothetical protein